MGYVLFMLILGRVMPWVPASAGDLLTGRDTWGAESDEAVGFTRKKGVHQGDVRGLQL